MNLNEWHWARLKKDLLIDDKYLLHFTETDPFTVPKGALMWVCCYTTIFGNGIRLTTSDAHIEKNMAAYQLLHDINYSDLLEPLE